MKAKYVFVGIIIAAVAFTAYLGFAGKLSKGVAASVYGIANVFAKPSASTVSGVSVGSGHGSATPSCSMASSSVNFNVPPTGTTVHAGDIFSVQWTWSNPTPAAVTSVYLVPQAGITTPILFSQYSTVTNVTTNGHMWVSPVNGNVSSAILDPTTQPGQYRTMVVSGSNQLVGCSGAFTVAAPLPACVPTFAYLSKWGTSGSANGQFANPMGVAADSSGNVYVADFNNNRIQKFTSTGAYITQWGGYGTGNGQFNDPWGIAVDGSNNVYVADAGNARIQKFTSLGTYVSQWGTPGIGQGQFRDVHAIAIDHSGNVYVTDSTLNRIQKFSSSGAFLLGWGSRGSGNGQFNSLLGIATDSAGNVYVTDTAPQGNHRIQKFSPFGTYLAQWGTFGSNNGQLSDVAQGIAVDSAGNVYVGDVANQRVYKFSPTGTYLGQVGSPGIGNGQFSVGGGYGVAIDPSGDVYVTDTNLNRVQKFGLVPCTQS